MPSFSDQNSDHNASGTGYQQYRSLSAIALVSLLLGMIGLLGFFSMGLLPISLGGIFIGLFAIRSVSKNSAHLSGKPLAILGTVLSIFTFIVAGSWHYYDEYIDIPEGYQVISFSELQPDTVAVGKSPIPKRAWQYNGQRILVKGYVYPHDQKKGLTHFVFVPDFDTCCFGGQPKLTDMIEVHLKDSEKVDFSWNRRKLGGILRIRKPGTGVGKVKETGYYEMAADYVD